MQQPAKVIPSLPSVPPVRYACAAGRFAVESVVACALAISLSGCTAERLVGLVTDINDEPLPGVSVTVRGRGHQDLTDAWGRFRLPVEPGPAVLDLRKTGYTPGVYELNVDPAGSLPEILAKLWVLPPTAGVYLYEGGRYRAARALEREVFQTAESIVYGTTKYDEQDLDAVWTANAEPLVICHGMPESAVGVHRLEPASVKLESGSETGITVLAPAGEVPASLRAIDEPKGVLRQVVFQSPLGPGIYAVHWGALGAADAPDPRLFVFRVGDAPLSAVPSETKQPESGNVAGNVVGAEAGTATERLFGPDDEDEGESW